MREISHPRKYTLDENDEKEKCKTGFDKIMSEIIAEHFLWYRNYFVLNIVTFLSISSRQSSFSFRPQIDTPFLMS